MIHRIFSNLPKFKNIELHEGLNVLLADREQTATDRQTRNRAGKSSIIQLIHFIMGAPSNRESLFRREELEKWNFGLDFDLSGKRIIVERNGSNHGRIIIRKADTTDWAIQPGMRRDVGNSLSLEDWCSVLGEQIFNIDATPKNERESFSPTFRSLFSYFVRRESEGGFRHPEAQSTMQQTYDQQIAVAYLLGLDWKIPQAWEMVRQREKNLRELKKAAEGGAFGDIISTSAQLRTQLALAEQKSKKIQNTLSHFEVLPQYRELEQEASQITRDISDLSNQDVLDEQLIGHIQVALKHEHPPENSDLARLYEESGVTLPETVIRRFDEVEKFHESIIANRQDYLSSELEAAKQRLNIRYKNIQHLDTRRGEIMSLLNSKGALDQFQKLQQEAARQDAETEAIRQRFQAAEQLEGLKTELGIERSRLIQRLRKDLDEQHERVTKAITTFEALSRSLYDQAGSLTLNPTDNGLKIDIRIQGHQSRGIQNMQVFCFDLMLMKICSAQHIGPKFLIHDSHLFDGVDERQIARALQLGCQTAKTCGWQYFVTMNSDDVPKQFEKGFNLDDYILPLHLTDATEDGGLFGFRF